MYYLQIIWVALLSWQSWESWFSACSCWFPASSCWTNSKNWVYVSKILYSALIQQNYLTFLGEVQRVALHSRLLLSSECVCWCLCVCVRVCMPRWWIRGKRFKITPLFFHHHLSDRKKSSNNDVWQLLATQTMVYKFEHGATSVISNEAKWTWKLVRLFFFLRTLKNMILWCEWYDLTRT